MASRYSRFFRVEVSNSRRNADRLYHYCFSQGMPLGNASACVCVLSILPLLKRGKLMPSRKKEITQSINFKHTHRLPYKVKTTCVQWLSWWHFSLNVYSRTLWLWKEECRRKKSVRGQLSNSFMTQKYWQSWDTIVCVCLTVKACTWAVNEKSLVVYWNI